MVRRAGRAAAAMGAAQQALARGRLGPEYAEAELERFRRPAAEAPAIAVDGRSQAEWQKS